MMADAKSIQERVQIIRAAINQQGKDLTPEHWKELLEEIAADVESYLQAVREEHDL